MCILEKEDLTLDELIPYYFGRLADEKKNIERVRRFYNDDNSFNVLMEKIIEKDRKRFDKLIKHEKVSNPWRVLFTIMEIVQMEGEEIPPFDMITTIFPSRSLMFRGWTFSWVHGGSTIITIYNTKDELIYRF